jgi:hypothetical protein
MGKGSIFILRNKVKEEFFGTNHLLHAPLGETKKSADIIF